jgi:hypothetical protein
LLNFSAKIFLKNHNIGPWNILFFGFSHPLKKTKVVSTNTDGAAAAFLHPASPCQKDKVLTDVPSLSKVSSIHK